MSARGVYIQLPAMLNYPPGASPPVTRQCARALFIRANHPTTPACGTGTSSRHRAVRGRRGHHHDQRRISVQRKARGAGRGSLGMQHRVLVTAHSAKGIAKGKEQSAVEHRVHADRVSNAPSALQLVVWVAPQIHWGEVGSNPLSMSNGSSQRIEPTDRLNGLSQRIISGRASRTARREGHSHRPVRHSHGGWQVW